LSRGSIKTLGALAFVWLATTAPTLAQTSPAPSQVAPPIIVPPAGAGRIAIPQVPAGAAIPAEAKKLRFKLLGFDIQGEFKELVPQREAVARPLVGRRVTVAQIFEFADKLQQIYVRAGYPLVRVVILPQEFAGAARIKLRIIDGFVERLDLAAIAMPVRVRVGAVLAPLVDKTHLTQGALERRLLIAGEAAGLVLNATFAAGKQVGGSVLILTGKYRPVSLSLYADNSMPAVFGTGQIVSSASLNSALGLGEQFTVSASGLPDKDFKTRFPTRRYLSAFGSIPIGIDGLKFEIGATNGITTPRVNMDVASQGLLKQRWGKLSYEAVKLRDVELTFSARYDSTNEEIDTLVLTPQVPLRLDKLRVVRGSIDGIWRGRATGTTVQFGSTYSHGLKGFGARTAAEATPLLPLSRQGADAVFQKWDGHVELNQALPQGFSVMLAAAGQTSFNHALLTSEQFDIDGAKMLSGFTAGALPGYTAWAVRGEIGHATTLPFAAGGLVLTPYVFEATGERLYIDPTAVETASIHATNYGAGVRFNLQPGLNYMANGYGFVEWSHRYANDPTLDGDRIFAGILLQY
jgi:hemolysin activation/secretion protein